MVPFKVWHYNKHPMNQSRFFKQRKCVPFILKVCISYKKRSTSIRKHICHTFYKSSHIYNSCQMESCLVVQCIGRKLCQQNSTLFINHATKSSHPHWQWFFFKLDTSYRTLNKYIKEHFNHHVLESHLQNHCLLLRRMHVRIFAVQHEQLVSQRSSELCRYMLRVSSRVTAVRQGTFFSLQKYRVIQNECRGTIVQRQFRTKFGNQPPSDNSIRRW